MNISTLLQHQGQRLLQMGIALFLYSSLDGFAIPFLASPRIGLSVHTLSALQGSLFQETFIQVLAYSSAPTGLTAFALILWGLRITAQSENG